MLCVVGAVVDERRYFHSVFEEDSGSEEGSGRRSSRRSSHSSETAALNEILKVIDTSTRVSLAWYGTRRSLSCCLSAFH